MNYEEVLDEFIEKEREKVRVCSGDDVAYEEAIIEYINKQRKLWIDFIEFILKKRGKAQVLELRFIDDTEDLED